MFRRLRLAWSCLVLIVTVVAVSPAHASLVWGGKRGEVCETPSVFYSKSHVSGLKPCCPSDDGVCPGGGVCPPSGLCLPSGAACVPATPPRPNVVLMISDDQGECHYGSAKECRSVESGTPIPAPTTPGLDALASVGTVFPIAHNTASWCYPSLNSILTGRYQKSFGGFRNQIADHYLTIPRVLRQLGKAPGTVVDTYDADARIGGYCTLQGGKFTASSGKDTGFDARVNAGERTIGRIDCPSNAADGSPLCGTDALATYQPRVLEHMRDVFDFLDSMIYPKPGGAPASSPCSSSSRGTPRASRTSRCARPTPSAATSSGTTAKAACSSWDNSAPRAPVRRKYVRSTRPISGACASSTPTCTSSMRTCARNPEVPGAHEPAPLHWRGWPGPLPGDAGHLRGRLGLEHLARSAAEHRRGVSLGQRLAAPQLEAQLLRERLSHAPPRVRSAQSHDGVESDALAHATDVLPSVLGYALGSTPGTQVCPTSDFDGTPCDGRDFRAQVGQTPSAPPSALRHSLCGHETRRPVRPARGRYLLTGPGTTGRCTLSSAATCSVDGDCAAGNFCLGGYCTAKGGRRCASTAGCAAGAVCLSGVCRAGPSCVDDSACKSLLGPPPPASPRTRSGA